jgi:hypothetical protein
MEPEVKSSSRSKHLDDTTKRLHILVFFTLFFLLISQIILIVIGLGSSVCVWIILLLLALNVSFYWHRRRIYSVRKKEIQSQHDSKYEIINLPKVYDFFCPRCLYQTNEGKKMCPNCKTGKLSPTTNNIDLWNK